jgi:ectoine hydroxylase-related dioxygenase (phytanoyl-CoA dioxygenase family)
MHGLTVSGDTSAFEVAAVLDGAGRLSGACARAALAVMETHGLVILTGLLSDAEADVAAGLIRQTIDDPARNRCAFASQTDNRYLRRDFCSLPAKPDVMGFAALLAQRLEGVLSHYCAPDHALLEVTTLTSYAGSSHQYVHRDPSGVISLFAAVEHVSAAQGGTVFVPGTQVFAGGAKRHDAAEAAGMELLRARWNVRILAHNLKKLWAMRGGRETPLAPGEFRDRVFSTHWDEHQPNLLRFLTAKNPLFSVRTLTPGTIWRLIREGRALDAAFPVVRTAPRKGTVILYQSDMLHAGPDNRTPTPRRLFSMSIAREAIDDKRWHAGYSPHPGLIERPVSFGDLLAYGRAVVPEAMED